MPETVTIQTHDTTASVPVRLKHPEGVLVVLHITDVRAALGSAERDATLKLQWDRPWNVTHVPSGCACAYFRRKVDAEKAMREMARWPGIEGLKRDTKMSTALKGLWLELTERLDGSIRP